MQTLLVFLFFALALSYLARRAYRSVSQKDAGCGKGCGCATDSDTIRVVGAKQ
ncbi:MAG: FeoB-associated Cys-rich membrane protein [Cytophagales bacterium]|nr:MAG: FeoB-associated Cys-rich membrane protein [Cytophagales bacterium]